GLLPDLLHDAKSDVPAKLVMVTDIDYDAQPAGAGAKAASSPPELSTLQFDKVTLPPKAAAPIRDSFGKRFPQGKLVELSDKKATESNVVQAASDATMLHFETHGFCVRLSTLQNVDEKLLAPGTDVSRSGLAFTGANLAASAADTDDGILWADEIATLDLHRV